MIFSAFERTVAMRYLRARRQEGFVSVIALFSLLGIMLGVATLIIVMAVMNGFRHELVGRVLGINGHLNIYALQGPMENWEETTERLRALPEVRLISPAVEGQALMSVGGNATGVVVRGVRPEDFATRPLVAGNIKQGSLADFGGSRVAIGRRMAERQGLGIGSELRLIAPSVSSTAFGSVPRMKTYQVAAIFEVGMFEYDSSFIFMPLEAAQTFFRLEQSVSTLELFLDDPDSLASAKQRIQPAIAGQARIVDWQKANESFFTALQVERNVMFLILTLIIVVAAFNIISSMIMLVKDKGRDIAILRTMGATRGSILRIFFLAGASVGVIGTVLGLILGVSFAANIESIRQGVEALFGVDPFNPAVYFLSQLPARIEWGEVFAVVLMALGLSFAATIYPSWRAARLDPVEALRYE